MVALRMAALRSATVISSSPMNFSRMFSSYWETLSIRSEWYCSASALRSSGMSTMSNLAPSSSSCQTSAFISTMSTSPAKLPSAPIGICSTTVLAPRRSLMDSCAL